MWRAGIPDAIGRVPTTSGFNLTIADEDTSDAVVRIVCEWVETNRMALRAVKESRGEAVIDVGVTVGSPRQFTASVVWAPSELALLAECGVQLCISAYPTSDHEEDAGPEPAV